MVIHANSELFQKRHFSLGQTEDIRDWQGLSPFTPAAEVLLPMTVQLPPSDLLAGNGTNSTDGGGGDAVPYGDVERIVIGIVLSIINLTTIGGNLLVIISVCIVKKLRQPSNYLVVSLAAADLSVALAVMPFVIITDLVGGEWLFGKVFCNVFIAMDVMCCTASIMNLCLISVDRYLGIMRPLTYPVRQNGKLMAKMVLTVWLLSASITLPPLFGWATNVTAERACLISQDLGYTVYSTAVAFYIPTAVMLLMYYRIYRAAQVSAARHKFISFPRQSGRPGAGSGGVGGGGGAVGVGVGAGGAAGGGGDGAAPGEAGAGERRVPPRRERLREECAALSRLLRPDRRQASVFKREQKAARTLGVIVGAFACCWLPFFLLSAARPFVCGAAPGCVPLRLERTLLWLGYANSLLNPLIYAAFNRDLRATYWNLLRCRYRHINRRLSAAGMHEALKAKDPPQCIL